MILADTNILLRAAQPGHAHHRAALDSMALLQSRDEEGFAVAPQNLYEMYVVCTRPISANGLGLTCQDAQQEIKKVRALFRVLPESANVCAGWEALIARHLVVGKAAHDAHLVAVMLDQGLTEILTFNSHDFARYPEIRALDPFAALSIPRIP